MLTYIVYIVIFRKAGDKLGHKTAVLVLGLLCLRQSPGRFAICVLFDLVLAVVVLVVVVVVVVVVVEMGIKQASSILLVDGY